MNDYATPRSVMGAFLSSQFDTNVLSKLISGSLVDLFCVLSDEGYVV